MNHNNYHRQKRKAKIMQRRKQRMLLIVSLCISFLITVFAVKKITMLLADFPRPQSHTKTTSVQPDSDTSETIPLSYELTASLKSLAEKDERVRTILKHYTDYPSNLLELLSKNEETLDFVYDYPDKKDAAPADSIGTVKKGSIPLLLQWDRRWGYSPYGDDIIALSGCGPTVLSMVASGLTGDATITPAKVADYAQRNSYYVEGTGTSWDLIRNGCTAFGISARELSLSENTMANQLSAGHPIICSMKPGDFTTTGHFIVLTGYSGGKFEVHDPNSKKRSSQLWSFDRLQGQINNLWAFSLL